MLFLVWGKNVFLDPIPYGMVFVPCNEVQWDSLLYTVQYKYHRTIALRYILDKHLRVQVYSSTLRQYRVASLVPFSSTVVVSAGILIWSWRSVVMAAFQGRPGLAKRSCGVLHCCRPRAVHVLGAASNPAEPQAVAGTSSGPLHCNEFLIQNSTIW